MNRKKGTGSIALRKDGVYAGKITYNGISKQFYSKDKAVVEDKIQNFINEMKINNVTKNSAMLFSEYVNNYLVTYKYGFIKDSSYDRLETVLRCQIKDSAIDIPLYKLDDMFIQRYINEQAKNLSLSTLKKLYQLIRLVLSYAYKKRDIDIDYAGLLFIPPVKKEVKQVEIYSDKEVDCLTEHVESQVSNIYTSHNIYRLYRYAFAYLIILNTGLRAGEILALTWNDIDFVNGLIHVRHSLSHVRCRDDTDNVYTDVITSLKTVNSVRDIPINKKCMKYIVWLKSANDECSNYLIHAPDGNFLKLRNLQQTFKRICSETGIRYKGLHALRHTFASRLINKGVAPKIVSDLLGHSSVVFTLNRYVHTYDDNLRNAVNNLIDL